MTGEVVRVPINALIGTIGCLLHERRAPIALIILATALSLLAAGCASLANTPAQDLAWSRWNICHPQAIGTEIRTVRLDGRISFWYYGPGDRQAMLDCLRRAASTGPALPEPVGESLPRGA
jgi:hypothetical protein